MRRHSHVFMVLSGHIQGVAYKKRVGNNGNVIHEILSNYQVEALSVAEGNYALFDDGMPKFYKDYACG